MRRTNEVDVLGLPLLHITGTRSRYLLLIYLIVSQVATLALLLLALHVWSRVPDSGSVLVFAIWLTAAISIPSLGIVVLGVVMEGALVRLAAIVAPEVVIRTRPEENFHP